jgi:hypothetical protein
MAVVVIQVPLTLRDDVSERRCESIEWCLPLV